MCFPTFAVCLGHTANVLNPVVLSGLYLLIKSSAPMSYAPWWYVLNLFFLRKQTIVLRHCQFIKEGPLWTLWRHRAIHPCILTRHAELHHPLLSLTTSFSSGPSPRYSKGVLHSPWLYNYNMLLVPCHAQQIKNVLFSSIDEMCNHALRKCLNGEHGTAHWLGRTYHSIHVSFLFISPMEHKNSTFL